jgi:uncharacterized protein DUF4235
VRRRAKSSELVVVVPEEQPEAPVVTKLMFAPVKIVSRRIAPRLASRLFHGLWRVVDDAGPPPRAEERQRSVTKLAFALALEGACTAIVGGLLDQASRREFARLTGRWPGRKAKS